jgi:hypothetical protein
MPEAGTGPAMLRTEPVRGGRSQPYGSRPFRVDQWGGRTCLRWVLGQGLRLVRKGAALIRASLGGGPPLETSRPV